MNWRVSICLGTEKVAHLDPQVEVLNEVVGQRHQRRAGDVVVVEDFVDLLLTRGGFGADGTLFSLLVHLELLLVCHGGQPRTEAHRNGAGEEFC
jgi:hypothetical protein